MRRAGGFDEGVQQAMRNGALWRLMPCLRRCVALFMHDDYLACGRQVLDKLRRAHTRVSLGGCVCGGFESLFVPDRNSDVAALKQVK